MNDPLQLLVHGVWCEAIGSALLYVSSMPFNDNASIPDQAQRISNKHAWAGFDADGELCCLFGGAGLVVWARKDTRSSVATASLPYPVSHAVASVVAVQVDYQQLGSPT